MTIKNTNDISTSKYANFYSFLKTTCVYTANCNENRFFPVYFFSQGKNLFSSSGKPVMKTGFSLCEISTQGKPCSGPVLAL